MEDAEDMNKFTEEMEDFDIHYMGMKDTSSHSVGGVGIGEGTECTPTVFHLEWPDDIRADIISWSIVFCFILRTLRNQSWTRNSKRCSLRLEGKKLVMNWISLLVSGRHCGPHNAKYFCSFGLKIF